MLTSAAEEERTEPEDKLVVEPVQQYYGRTVILKIYMLSWRIHILILISCSIWGGWCGLPWSCCALAFILLSSLPRAVLVPHMAPPLQQENGWRQTTLSFPPPIHPSLFPAKQQSRIGCLICSCCVPGEMCAQKRDPVCWKETATWRSSQQVQCLPVISFGVYQGWSQSSSGIGEEERSEGGKKPTVPCISTDLFFKSCNSTAECGSSVTLVWYQHKEKFSPVHLSTILYLSLMTAHHGCVDDNSVSESVGGIDGKDMPGFVLELRE